MIKTAVNNNRGISLVELLTVIVIIALAVGGAIIGIGIIASGNAKKASKSIQSVLNEVRTSTLSIQAEWQVRIYNDDGEYKVSIYRDNEEWDTTELGSRIDIAFDNLVSESGRIDENMELVIRFKASSGTVESITYGEMSMEGSSVKADESSRFQMTISASGGDYKIVLWYDTGKVTAEE